MNNRIKRKTVFLLALIMILSAIYIPIAQIKAADPVPPPAPPVTPSPSPSPGYSPSPGPRPNPNPHTGDSEPSTPPEKEKFDPSNGGKDVLQIDNTKESVSDANHKEPFTDIEDGLNPIKDYVPAQPYPIGDTVNIINGESKKKFENPKTLMSRSEFLMAMLQTKNIIESRPVHNLVAFSRYNNRTGVVQQIQSEPVEDSGFLQYMGQLGLDAGQTDVILSHEKYGSDRFVVNPNVIELYLNRAYQLGLINTEDINKDGDGSGLYDLIAYSYDKTNVNPSGNHRVRFDTSYGPYIINGTKGPQIGKQFEKRNIKDGQYPEKYDDKWKQIRSTRAYQRMMMGMWNPNTDIFGSSFSYKYNNVSKEDLDLWPNIVAKEESAGHYKVEDRLNAEVTATRREPIINDPNGFRILKNENISYLDALVYTAKFLKSAEDDIDLSDELVDALNSSYGTNLAGMSSEESKAVMFLIAKGIVDGDDKTVSQSYQLPLSNELAVRLLYKIHFKEARKFTEPVLTETDKAMLAKGYGKASVSINKNMSEFPSTYVGNPDEATQSEFITDVITKKDVASLGEKNNGEYRLIAIRLPKVNSPSDIKQFQLMVNDSYRIPVPHEPIQNEYQALEDGAGYRWRFYTVHRDTITDLKLLAEIKLDGQDKTTSFSFTGINSDGLYWIDETNNRYSIRKWEIDTLRAEQSADNLNKKPISSFLSSKDTEKGKKFIEKILDINNRMSVWEDSNSNFDILSMNKMTKLLSQTKKPDNLAEEVLKELSDYAKLIQTGAMYPKDVDKLIRVRSGLTPIQVAYSRESYANPEIKGEIRPIIHGPLTISQLQNTKLGGESLIVMEGEGITVNQANTTIKQLGLASRITLIPTEMNSGEIRYNIQYKPKTKDTKTETAKLMRMLTTDSVGDSKIGGYAKIEDTDGTDMVLVSKSELKEFGIEALSDKVLFNPLTGQRAFINTDDNVTLIGNNITHYSEGNLLVNAFGAINSEEAIETSGKVRDESKIFYNLNVILELINNTDIVSTRAGKDFFVGIDGEKFDVVDIQNKEDWYFDKDGVKKNPIVDTTYIYKNNVTPDVFLNLSSMAGLTSNMIYFKNKSTSGGEAEALVVFKPDEDYIPYNGEIDNSLKREMIEGVQSYKDLHDITDSSFDTQSIDFNSYKLATKSLSSNPLNAEIFEGGSQAMKEIVRMQEQLGGTIDKALEKYQKQAKAKTALINTLFLGSKNESDDIFGNNYQFKVFILNRNPSVEGRKSAMANFLTYIGLNTSQTNNEEFYKALQGKVNIDSGVLNIPNDWLFDDTKYQEYMNKHSQAGLTFEVLDIATSPAQANPNNWKNKATAFEFLAHEATGNLYFSLGSSEEKDGKTATRNEQLKKYQFIFENNIYLDNTTDAEGNQKHIVTFKPRHIYQNTNRNTIPLETYAMHTGYFGAMFINGGKNMKNFEFPDGNSNYTQDKRIKLANHIDSSNTAIKYVHRGIDTKDRELGVGMFTRLSMPPVLVKFLPKNIDDKGQWSTTYKVLDNPAGNDKPYQTKTKTEDITEDTTDEELLKMLWWDNLESFDKEREMMKGKEIYDRNFYDAIYRAKIKPEEVYPQMYADMMNHSWAPILSGDVDYTFDLVRKTKGNYNYKFPKEMWGEEVIFLVAGQSPEFKHSVRVASAGKNAKKHLMKTEKGMPYKLYAVRTRVNKDGRGVEDWARFQIENIKTTFKEDNQEVTKVPNSIVPIKTFKDLEAIAYSPDGKMIRPVFTLPSISLPYGSTVVNREGNLVVLPNPTYREEILYATNVVNSLIFRMTLNNPKYEGRTFLHELPKGSVVRFGDNQYLIKATPEQPKGKNQPLKWIQMLTSPWASSQDGQVQMTGKEYLTDYATLDSFLRTYANKVRLPYNGVGNAEVSLKSILGKGIYNLPTSGLITETINSLSIKKTQGPELEGASIASNHYPKGLNIWTNEIIGKESKFFPRPVSASRVNSNAYRYGEMQLDENVMDAYTNLLIYLPPTIEVKKIVGGNTDAHYEVLMYHDIAGFQVDKDNSYVQYLKERDTDAEDLLKDLYQIDSVEKDGRKYLDFTKNKISTQEVNRWLKFIENTFPIILIILVLFMWIFYVLLQFPISRTIIIKIVNAFKGKNSPTRWEEYDQDGNVSTGNLPRFTDVFIVGTAIVIIAIALKEGLIVALIMKLLDVFKAIIEKVIR